MLRGLLLAIIFGDQAEDSDVSECIVTKHVMGAHS